jgi:hypothetical protein
MNVRAAQRIKYGRRAWYTTVPTLLVLYPIAEELEFLQM